MSTHPNPQLGSQPDFEPPRTPTRIELAAKMLLAGVAALAVLIAAVVLLA